MAGECPLKVGDKFASFADVEKEIQQLEKHQWITYYRRDSRTIFGAKKRGLKRDIEVNDRLKFYEAKYACLKGGRMYKSTARRRPNQRSFREQCGSFVQFRVSKDGQHLVVVDMSVHHNHPLDKGMFQSLPKQRRLNEEEWQSMKSILATKPTKRSLQLHIRKSTGKMVTLRDLTNHSGKLKKVKSNDSTVAAPIPPSFVEESLMEPSDMYKQAFCEAQKLATMASEVSVAKFKQRLAVLSDLVNLWEMDVEAAVTGISDESTDNDDNSGIESVQVPQSHKESSVSPMDPPISEFKEEVKHSHILDHVPQPGVFDNSKTPLQFCECGSEEPGIKISVVEDIPSTSGQCSSGRQTPKNVGIKLEWQDS
ncbi:uncharacterized protein LOC117105594 [Anneissia japonica]|uniref:uncharacterized protein LOC117105594 n=1 Tax=Anneissia japonica TaxID=1529436 RepID=UPI0014255D38|nr:uncharacterized protein LOC117105594 [Anneissia japonica]